VPAAPEPSYTPTNLTEAATRIAAADRAGQTRGLVRLGAWAVRPAAAVNAFNALLATGPEGPRLALELIVRMSADVPHSLALLAGPHLSDPAVPATLKLAVAAKFLSVLPDRPEAIGPVLRAVTAGLKKSKALARLVALQSRVETCEALDTAVAIAEARTKVKCPVCGKSLTRPALVKHLAKKHRTGLERGKAVSPVAAAEALISAVDPNDPATIDRAFLRTPALFPQSTPADVLQGLASRHYRRSDQYAPLADRAGESYRGLCPKCYAPVPDPVTELPPPLTLAHGRLAGEGYCVTVADGPFGRRVTFDRPGTARTTVREGGLPPRTAGVAFALPFALAAATAAIAVPSGVRPGPGWVALWLVIVAVCVYAATVTLRRKPPDANGRAVDLAWSVFAPGIGRSPEAARFLTRLCRTSLTAGEPGDRGKPVWELADHAGVLAQKGGPFVSLFSAAAVLRAVDAGKIGRDVVGELHALFVAFFRGELPAPTAEHMAALVADDVALGTGERARLTVLVASAAFDAGLVPADLPGLRRYVPHVVLLFPDDADDLRALYAVWRQKPTRPWDRAGACETIFTLAVRQPGVAVKALKADPGAVLVFTPESFLYDLLGPVTVSRKGVRFGGATVVDPRAEVAIVTTREGGELTFGKSAFTLARRPDEAIERALRRLLAYRAESLMPLADAAKDDTPTGRGDALLAPLAVACPLCATVSYVRSGQLGVPRNA
jgi:predicted RNA-binding Zn-ribbon protein involved in translation (DUF1610 family)